MLVVGVFGEFRKLFYFGYMGWEGRGILRGDMMVWKKRFNFENVKLIML